MQPAANQLARFLSRFVFFYWICFLFPFPLDLLVLPFNMVPEKSQPAWMKEAGDAFGKGYLWLANQKADVCKWVGREYLGVTVIIQPTGSGDTMRAYVGVFCAAWLALAAALLWTILLLPFGALRTAGADSRLHAAVRILVRFFLMQMLFGYGFAKVFPLQFPEPTYRLTQTFGDFSPMGLLWAFMGFSPIYQIITGSVEVLGGLLMATRRTTPLGAIVTVVAMTHIAALNLCFDVPVKLYSLHYLAMGLFLLAPDFPRIMKVMVLRQAVDAAPLPHLFGRPRLSRAALVVRTVITAAILWSSLYSHYEMWVERNGPTPVHGRWEVQSMTLDGKDAADSPTRWKELDFSLKGIMRLYGPKPPPTVYKVTWDEGKKQLTLGKFVDPKWSAEFTYELTGPDVLRLAGKLEGKPTEARLKRLPDKQYELTKRGFHWIQEMPFNR